MVSTAVNDRVLDNMRSRAEKTERPLFLEPKYAKHPCDRFLWLESHWMGRKTVDPCAEMNRLSANLWKISMVMFLDVSGYSLTSDAGKGSYTDYIDSVSLRSGCIEYKADAFISNFIEEAPMPKALLHLLPLKSGVFKKVKELGLKAAMPPMYGMFNAGLEVASRMYQGTRNAFIFMMDIETNEMASELLELDLEEAKRTNDRVNQVCTSPDLPKFQQTAPCTMCRFHDFCHRTKMTTEINCRTCASATLREDGLWLCDRRGMAIPPEIQRSERACHILHPDSIPYRWDEEISTNECYVYVTEQNVSFKNGNGGWNSREIIEGKKDNILKIANDFGGTIVRGQ